MQSAVDHMALFQLFQALFLFSFLFLSSRMPFRCRCGRTFEKTESFTTHTSSCVPFHHRRMSDTFQSSHPLSPSQSYTDRKRQGSLPFINTSIAQSLTGFLTSPTRDTSPILNDLSPLFMPTALSLQNAFEGARRRSSSSHSTLSESSSQ
ncbi:hypothetical protein BY458DRAFT_516539 [Sporodiniella umbellata]|nr:hypothetical protein BY458DRAFT_516539 [Sporodiniella umbellata]